MIGIIRPTICKPCRVVWLKVRLTLSGHKWRFLVAALTIPFSPVEDAFTHGL
jgi:hypothetical protein